MKVVTTKVHLDAFSLNVPHTLPSMQTARLKTVYGMFNRVKARFVCYQYIRNLHEYPFVYLNAYVKVK